MSYETIGGGCPLCGFPYRSGSLHGHGICVASYHPAPAPLTADDVRRIVREELERAGRKP